MHASEHTTTPPAQACVSHTIRDALSPRQEDASACFFHDAHFDYDTVNIQPGAYFVTAEDLMLVADLGMGIAVCLWEPTVRVGGMNHFLLPGGDHDDASPRYGHFAMHLLIQDMLQRGARRERLQAKVFGGANDSPSAAAPGVGTRNTACALEELRSESIAVHSSDVLGPHHRKLRFFPAHGSAMVKHRIPQVSDPYRATPASTPTPIPAPRYGVRQPF
ncbi:chemoreceptor glutamine deamidase CheD [Hydrogenophaga sp.]|uniref:chemoreceptor glutamine deamidase CheD n=1 Tax=Hydrogenophaga sp. TaxID=1904254 RepID=UPI003567D398